jgi:putative chitinase
MKEILKKIYPHSTEANREKYAKHIERAMLMYDISTINRKRAFLAQIGHESGQLSSVEENLNYSADALREFFGNYFKTEFEAKKYARRPEEIANRVYAHRLGNGGERIGDGWRYRGRGLIQITGAYNYRRVTDRMTTIKGVDFIKNPELLATPEYATQSAAWFWKSNGLNELADKLGDEEDTKIFKEITKKINGGYNGLADRLAIYERSKLVIL